MEESILNSVKKQVGIMPDCTDFDDQLIMHINTTLMILTQLGVGPPQGFVIEDEYTTWEDYLGDTIELQMVKTYIGHKVRLLFDPPSSSTHMNAITQAISELEWRLNVAVDPAE